MTTTIEEERKNTVEEQNSATQNISTDLAESVPEERIPELTSSQFQDKEWRTKQEWYINGKHNECEIYQRSVVETITSQKCFKTDIRINFNTKEMLPKKYPMKDDDGFDWTEDFDGVIKNGNDTFYINLKFICDSGGSQTRSLREVSHFVHCQQEVLVKHNLKNVYFVNILDGDTSFKSISKFNHILNKKEFSEQKKFLFVSDMSSFKSWWNNYLTT